MFVAICDVGFLLDMSVAMCAVGFLVGRVYCNVCYRVSCWVSNRVSYRVSLWAPIVCPVGGPIEFPIEFLFELLIGFPLGFPIEFLLGFYPNSSLTYHFQNNLAACECLHAFMKRICTTPVSGQVLFTLDGDSKI